MASSSSSSNRKQLLLRHLAPFRTLRLALTVSERLFRKQPHLHQQLLSSLEAKSGQSQAHRVHHVHAFLVQTILSVCDRQPDDDADQARLSLSLPTKLSSYLAFLDLSSLVLEAHKSKQWHTFVLQDYQSAPNESFPLEKLRRRLKDFLPKENLSSVQIEVEDDEPVEASASAPAPSSAHAPLRVFFRVVTMRRTKTGRHDDWQLMRRLPGFFVYYPHQPYFFTDKEEPDPLLCEALCRCLNSSDYVRIPLSGPDLNSLHRMRLYRDGQGTKMTISRSQDDLDNPFDVQRVRTEEETDMEVDPEGDGGGGGETLPVLNKLVVLNSPSEFQAHEVLVRHHDGAVPNQVDFLDLDITIKSSNVLESLQSMVRLSSPSSDPAAPATHGVDPKSYYVIGSVPKWIREAPNRGRNQIVLKRNDPAGAAGAATTGAATSRSQPREDDAMSVAGSEMTVLNRRF